MWKRFLTHPLIWIVPAVLCKCDRQTKMLRFSFNHLQDRMSLILNKVKLVSGVHKRQLAMSQFVNDSSLKTDLVDDSVEAVQ